VEAPFHGFAFWFDVEFNGPAIFSSNNNVNDPSQAKRRGKNDEVIVLSTAPEDPPTHWQQVLKFSFVPLVVPHFITKVSKFIYPSNSCMTSTTQLCADPALLL